MATIETIPLDSDSLPFEIDVNIQDEDFTFRFSENDEFEPNFFIVEILKDDITIGISKLNPDFSIIETTVEDEQLNNLFMSSIEDFLRLQDGQTRLNPTLTVDNFGVGIELLDLNT